MSDTTKDETTQPEQETQPEEESIYCDGETMDSSDLCEEDKKLCSICQDYFWDDNSLIEHQEKHAAGLICSICGYECSSQSSMIAHSRAHMDQESIQCLMCKERLSEEGQFELHIAAHAKKLTSCPWCPYINKGASDLKKHLDAHLKSFRMNCNFCKYYSFSTGDLKTHNWLHEIGLKGVLRRTRNMSEKYRGASERKKRDHDEDLKDGVKTTRRGDLTALLSRAVFRCCLCGARLPNHAAFEAHQSEHVKPGFAYCPYCSYRTDDRELIIHHVLQHIQDYPGSAYLRRVE